MIFSDMLANPTLSWIYFCIYFPLLNRKYPSVSLNIFYIKRRHLHVGKWVGYQTCHGQKSSNLTPHTLSLIESSLLVRLQCVLSIFSLFICIYLLYVLNTSLLPKYKVPALHRNPLSRGRMHPGQCHHISCGWLPPLATNAAYE